MSDGTITFRTDLDNKQLERKLAKETKKIEKTERYIRSNQKNKNMWSEQAKSLGVKLDEAKSKLHEMQSAADGVFSNYQISAQKSRVGFLQAQWDTANDNVDKYGKNIENATIKLNEQKRAAAAISDSLAKKADMENAFESSLGRFDKLLSRVSKLASRVFVFSMITSGLRSLRDWMGDVIATNDEASAALARLKGALLTMVQPLVSVVIPAFTTLVNLLTAVIGKIAEFISAIGGKTVQESADAAKALNKQANAMGGVGSAAEEASKSLAGFDEINKLSGETSANGDGGAGATDIQPDFSWADSVSDTLDKIANYVLLIGAGLALWKIGEMLPGKLGDILGKLGLILATVGFLLIAWDGIKDAWENGVDWGNMAEMILGVAGAAGALYLAFGNVASGIALMVSGGALLVTAFRDIMESGFNLQNTLLAIAGIMAAGLGISLLAGSWIPLLIAGIASLLLAIVYFTGHGEELIAGLRQVCQGFIDFFTGAFSGDWDKAWQGIVNVGKGAVNILISIINSMISLVVAGLNMISFDVPSWIPVIGGKRVGFNIQNAPQIPYLAQGAVIPPNREFMAVLGDQTHGNNIEAPEDLIRKIVREETARNDNGKLEELLKTLISVVEHIEVGDDVIGRAAARYNRNTSRARGW